MNSTGIHREFTGVRRDSTVFRAAERGKRQARIAELSNRGIAELEPRYLNYPIPQFGNSAIFA
ncbi:MAG: hypothetical protein LAO06_04795 [Acidobacteriia bacterium]|nr:hypothetical protein [Terriglobia bacterium]